MIHIGMIIRSHVCFLAMIGYVFSLSSCGIFDVFKRKQELSKPTEVTVRARSEQLQIRWQPPDDKGQSDITDYELELNGSGVWTSIREYPPYNLDNLNNLETYMIKIRAVNEEGHGLASDAIFAEPSNEERTFRSTTQKCRSRGRGSESNPIIVCHYDDLKHLVRFANRDNTLTRLHIEVAAHIDGTQSREEGNDLCLPEDASDPEICKGWKPLPKLVESTIRGDGHTIFGLYARSSEKSANLGLFSEISKHSLIKNLHMNNPDFVAKGSSSNVGAFAGQVSVMTKFDQTSVKGGHLVGNVAGGMVGLLDSSYIRNSFVYSAIDGHSSEQKLTIKGALAGGIAGWLKAASVIHSAASKASVEKNTHPDAASDTLAIGGIAGLVDGGSKVRYTLSYSGGTAGSIRGSSDVSHHLRGPSSCVSSVTTTEKTPTDETSTDAGSTDDSSPNDNEKETDNATPGFICSHGRLEPRTCVHQCGDNSKLELKFANISIVTY
ncbi:MAG: fibronectin type III domain-containing protein [Proteobacteria bacterium]|nr:fibronectin type III domain-containing protein [Pseudomonadota bacterium]